MARPETEALSLINKSTFHKYMFMASMDSISMGEGVLSTGDLLEFRQLDKFELHHNMPNHWRRRDAYEEFVNIHSELDLTFTIDPDSAYGIDLDLRGDIEPCGNAFSDCSEENCRDYDDVGLYIDLIFPLPDKVLNNIKLVDEYLQKEPNLNTNLESNNEMTNLTNKSRVSSVLSATVQSNKQASILAAKLAVGKAANTLTVKAVKGKLPLVVRGYAETVVGEAVLANMVMVAVQTFMPENKKAAVISQAMVDSAMVSLVNQIDITGILEGVFNKIDGLKLDELMADSDNVTVD